MKIHLYEGDCCDLMGTIKPGSVDVIVTSPPYNLNKNYGRVKDKKEWLGYYAWCHAWLHWMYVLLHENGSLFLNLGAASEEPLAPFRVLDRATKDKGEEEGNWKFQLQNTIHWIKSVSFEEHGETVSKGHFKPVNSPRYLTGTHEYVFHLTKTGRVPMDRLAVGVPFADKTNIKRFHGEGAADRRCRGNTWLIPYDTIQNRDKDRPHPATFPVALPEWCIKLHKGEGLTVLDPFMGIGTSAVAAQRCGDKKVSRFIGIDLEPSFVAEARKRTAQV